MTNLHNADDQTADRHAIPEFTADSNLQGLFVAGRLRSSRSKLTLGSSRLEFRVTRAHAPPLIGESWTENFLPVNPRKSARLFRGLMKTNLRRQLVSILGAGATRRERRYAFRLTSKACRPKPAAISVYFSDSWSASPFMAAGVSELGRICSREMIAPRILRACAYFAASISSTPRTEE